MFVAASGITTIENRKNIGVWPYEEVDPWGYAYKRMNIIQMLARKKLTTLISHG